MTNPTLIGRLCIAVCLLAVSTIASAQVCTVPPPGLIGWWPGNGTPVDAVTGVTGQLAGDTTYLPAIVDRGFKLDGFGDFVEIPDSLVLRPAHMSVEAWVRFDAQDTPIVSQFGAAGLQYIVFKKNSRVFNFEAYALRKQRANGIDRFAFSVANVNGLGNIALSTTAVVVGQFYHVVGSYDGSTVKIYVNGVLEGQSSTSITVDYGTRPVFIGTSGETVFDGKLNGVVDEPSVYGRALTAAEVTNLYAAGVAGKCRSASGLVASLASLVQTLNVSNGISNSLDMKLQNVLSALDDLTGGNVWSACNRMGAFINEVNAQSGKTLTTTQAQQLLGLAGQIRASMQCSK